MNTRPLDALKIPLAITIAFWVIEFAENIFGFNIHEWGIYPRKFDGIIGIVISPFLHADFSHLLSNSTSFLLLGFSILFFFPRIGQAVFINIYMLTGLGVWLFGRPAYHIGASGLVYGFASFLFFSGIFRKDIKSTMVSLSVAFLYGGMLYGIFPNDPKISFESHLIGAIVGLITAYYYKNYDKEEEVSYSSSSHSAIFEGYHNIENKYMKYHFKQQEEEK
ncbi:rhomboid family intramembrane serine protease [Flammeovirgaceae bacterium SG7u.111]|nr:rhomboid family intramembrane serine protease [Flammeovirgaceae bacterium SG7u.132]WPO36893.1 rhomboid family intramembrane serine protease [Flammeovirgaceae bacterium SG7u.111]